MSRWENEDGRDGIMEYVHKNMMKLRKKFIFKIVSSKMNKDYQ